MLIEIFDVTHGSCALVTGDNGQHILLDCGTDKAKGFTPAAVLMWRGIPKADLIVSHADEDHVSGLPELHRHGLVGSIITNDSLTSGTIRLLKERCGSRIGPGVELLMHLKGPFMSALRRPDHLSASPEAVIWLWRVPYPSALDLNDLSLVTFLEYGGIRAVFPGDLERAGWQLLLGDARFRAQLARVNVFVASHHGRDSGYHPGVFAFCAPEIIIASDGPVEFGSQDCARRYRPHSSGVRFGTTVRYVLTTRRDGRIVIWESLATNQGAWVVLN